jgi:predicted DNA-binding transcriptional regulator YafY
MSRKRTHRNSLLVRLLGILGELEQNGGRTIDELALLHNVTTRTIRRDLDALQEAHVPLIVDDDGGRKRWRIVRSGVRALAMSQSSPDNP